MPYGVAVTTTVTFSLFDPVAASQMPVFARRMAYSGRACSVLVGSGRASERSYVPGATPVSVTVSATLIVLPGSHVVGAGIDVRVRSESESHLYLASHQFMTRIFRAVVPVTAGRRSRGSRTNS